MPEEAGRLWAPGDEDAADEPSAFLARELLVRPDDGAYTPPPHAGGDVRRSDTWVSGCAERPPYVGERRGPVPRKPRLLDATSGGRSASSRWVRDTLQEVAV